MQPDTTATTPQQIINPHPTTHVPRAHLHQGRTEEVQGHWCVRELMSCPSIILRAACSRQQSRVSCTFVCGVVSGLICFLHSTEASYMCWHADFHVLPARPQGTCNRQRFVCGLAPRDRMCAPPPPLVWLNQRRVVVYPSQRATRSPKRPPWTPTRPDRVREPSLNMLSLRASA